MTPDRLIEELKKLPNGANIRYLDIDDGSFRYSDDGSLNWKHLDEIAVVGIDWPEEGATGER
jgi:hypothetical protein